MSLHDSGIYPVNGTEIVPRSENGKVKKLTGRDADQASARKGAVAYSILEAHNTSDDMEHLKLQFDSMAPHDITFVGVVQTVKASGIETFPIPCALTNCHNTLRAVGGIINEDDHMFGLSAAKKYGSTYIPPYIAAIHQYMREMIAGCGRMIPGSNSHTRYEALGTTATGEGGGELMKQPLKGTYDVTYPGVVAVHLDGTSWPGISSQDIALAIIGVVLKNGYVKSKTMEFAGPGMVSMTADYRNGMDVMITEITRLSSIWKTNSNIRAYLAKHHRERGYKEPAPVDTAYYDGCVYVGLSTVKPTAALPFHSDNIYEIDEFKADLDDILGMVEAEAAEVSDEKASLTPRDKIEGDQPMVQRAAIAGCVGGTYSNVMEAVHVLKRKNCGCDEFSLAVYPSSQPVFTDLMRKGTVPDLMDAGAIIRTAFCGSCSDTGDTPCNNSLSVCHTIRNFPNRGGSGPGNGQIATVALMDACSIVATAASGGRLASAWEPEGWDNMPEYELGNTSYKNWAYIGCSKGDGEKELVYGPNIKGWPEISPLADNILLKVCFKITSPMITIDKLTPSGEISSYRSNPLGLAGFTLSRRDPEYVGGIKEVDKLEKARAREGAAKEVELEPVLEKPFDVIRDIGGDENVTTQDTEVGSIVYTTRPGDGSVREQAASCQGVVGGLASICKEYTTKRYRSNVMNQGMVPFQMEEDPRFGMGDYIYAPGIRKTLDGDLKGVKAYVLGKEGNSIRTLNLYITDMTAEEREIVRAGRLINYNRNRH